MRKFKQSASTEDFGWHNQNLDASIARLHRGNTYRDLSTIWITVTRGMLCTKIVSNWMSIMKPMNQKFFGPLFIENEEVGAGYQKAFDLVLNHPDLSKWKYILTVEEDNTLPQDALLKLYESIGEYDCIAGLYWTKGEMGQPMIYGNPAELPKNFVPQCPRPDTVQHCNGLGMGANLWKIESFKTKLKDMPKPWFQTIQEIGKGYTQDLWFFQEAAKYGYKVACNTAIKCGHIDIGTGMIW
jgi:hypothetical protein